MKPRATGDVPVVLDAARERRLDDLLVAVFERTDVDRKAFLEQACDGDETLLADALDHLASEQDLGDFLERPAFLDLPDDDSVPRPARPSVAGVDDTTVLANPDSGGLRRRLEDLGKKRLGSYEIVGYAGGGGMGQVYIGEDARLRRQVAIKTLPEQLAQRPGWRQRFEQEARALGTLNHPNIVTIYSIEEDAGIHFLTMELVAGQTLKDILPPEGMPLDDLLRIASSLTSALAAAHDRGVIHRDLKPANVMTTADGRVKVLDFGIAKVSGEHQISEDGRLIGTVPYMAPEQLRGEDVDLRCDLFSLGVLLYLLASGRHPFPASSAFRRVSAILWHEPEALGEVRPELPMELVDIIDRCLEKDADDRYQTAAEIEAELRELQEVLLTQRLLGSRTDLQIQSPPRGSAVRWVWATALLAAVVLLLVLQLRDAPSTSRSGAAEVAVEAASDRLRVAVLPFRNLTEDPTLHWLANGISELLITDLSQSTDLAILGAASVDLALQDLATPGKRLSAETVRAVAETTRATVIVRGSYTRLGDSLRLVYRVEDPISEEVLRTETLQGEGVESLFQLVDELSAAILMQLQASRPETGPQTIGEATTRSVAAWQAYSEAVLLRRKMQNEEAIGQWERAIELDPGFAMAYAQISRVRRNLGQDELAKSAAAKAFELLERLPLDDRFDVEASFYESNWGTTGQAIETYRIALGLYPHRKSWRNNLARRYAFFEQYEQALEGFESLLVGGTRYIGTYTNAANVYAALDQHQQGDEVLGSFDVEQGGWLIHFSKGYHLTEWGRYDLADEAYHDALEVDGDHAYLAYGRWRLEVLRQQWKQAQREAETMVQFGSDFARWRGHLAQAQNWLYRGESEAALGALQQAVEGSEGSDRARAHLLASEIYLQRGEPLKALAAARQAQGDGARQWTELEGMYRAARAELSFGRRREAEQLKDDLSERWRRQPNAVEERQILALESVLASAQGNPEEAIEILQRALRLLPPRGVEFSWHAPPHHVPLGFTMGSLEWAAGRPEKALPWLLEVTNSGVEHLEHPLVYVRSFYLAGRAAEALGQANEARRLYSAFLEFWGEGDLEPQWVDDAKRRLDALGRDAA